MNNFSSFGNWLKAQRQASGLTQDALGRRVYCATITIRKMEADQLRPSRELAELIVNYFSADSEQSNVVDWIRHGTALMQR